MATYIENLVTARNKLAEELAGETTARAAAQAAGSGVKTTFTVEGRQTDWNGYLAAMTAQIDKLNEMIGKGDPNDQDEWLYEQHVRGYT